MTDLIATNMRVVYKSVPCLSSLPRRLPTQCVRPSLPLYLCHMKIKIPHLRLLIPLRSPATLHIPPLLRLARNVSNSVQRRAQLDDAEPQHARLDAQRAAHGVLRSGIAVEAHDKVVADVVARAALAALGRLGHVEDAPVGDAAD